MKYLIDGSEDVDNMIDAHPHVDTERLSIADSLQPDPIQMQGIIPHAASSASCRATSRRCASGIRKMDATLSRYCSTHTVHTARSRPG
jgi:hypothetical protein